MLTAACAAGEQEVSSRAPDQSTKQAAQQVRVLRVLLARRLPQFCYVAEPVSILEHDHQRVQRGFVRRTRRHNLIAQLPYWVHIERVIVAEGQMTQGDV